MYTKILNTVQPAQKSTFYSIQSTLHSLQNQGKKMGRGLESISNTTKYPNMLVFSTLIMVWRLSYSINYYAGMAENIQIERIRKEVFKIRSEKP